MGVAVFVGVCHYAMWQYLKEEGLFHPIEYSMLLVMDDSHRSGDQVVCGWLCTFKVLLLSLQI